MFELKTGISEAPKVVGHTMEYMDIYPWEVFVVPRKSELKLTEETNSSNAAAKTVTSKYGFLAYGAWNFLGDGMNEKGLALATQTLYQSEYQKCDPSSSEYTTIFTAFLPNWILSSFSTVDEVIGNISSGKFCISNPAHMKLTNTHWSIVDAAGKSLVLEFERGEAKMYNNAVGVMTNDPWYPWHVQNINTYAWISNEVPSQKDLQVETDDLLPNQDKVPWVMGKGFNTGGLPGDGSPPSRFVKMFFERQIAMTNSPPKKLDDWLVLAQAILNTIFIPSGMEEPDGRFIPSGHTAWATLRVPATGFFAFRTYEDMQWHVVNTHAIDWNQKKSFTPSKDINNGFKDITSHFKTKPSFLGMHTHVDDGTSMVQIRDEI